jgi:hypothetical protein
VDVLGNCRRNGLARAAPCGKGIDEDDGLLRDRLLELRLAVKREAELACRGERLGGGSARGTYVSMIWTVILGELVVKSLGAIGCCGANLVLRRMLKAGLANLVDIGMDVGG